MVDIHIYKDYYLKSDALQFILYELKIVNDGKTKGANYEHVLGYYGNPAMACAHVLDIVGRNSNAKSMSELRDVYVKCKDEIISNFKWIDEGRDEVKEVVKKRRTK